MGKSDQRAGQAVLKRGGLRTLAARAGAAGAAGAACGLFTLEAKHLVHGGFHFANSYKVLKNGFSSPVDVYESILEKDKKVIDNQAIMR